MFPGDASWLSKLRNDLAQMIPGHRILRRLRGTTRRALGGYRLRRAGTRRPCRIVLGASGIAGAGWTVTEIETLDIRLPSAWERYFRPGSIDAILAEHVWEHLTPSEGLTAARLCHRHLAPGGYLRIAVPDGLHPDTDYIQWVRVGGVGPGADDHRVLYTYRTLQALLESAGFAVQRLEYFDEAGQFHSRDWDIRDGVIHRSARFDSRNQSGQLRYTSIIMDARKDAP